MKLFVATKNKNKLAELERILLPLGFELVTENDLHDPVPEVDETGDTCEENAFLKARSGMISTGLPTFADDTGLFVDALDGAPGVYAARYSGENATYESNNIKLLKALEGVPYEKRTATFVTAIACVFPDGREFTVRGECKGHIAEKCSNGRGFGYDPVFVCELGCFSEITSEQKDSVSHRGRALKKFSEKILEYIEE